MHILSAKYTAFSAVDGHWEYAVMPQGAKNAASHFAALVEEAFGSLRDDLSNPFQKMMVYQDDILNFSTTLVDQLLQQQKIYNIMRDYGLIFKIIKAHINYKTQRVLGHILTKDGRFPDPSLTKTIKELARPTTLQGIQSLLGLAQVAREYIPALATMIAPIQALSKKGVDVEKAWKKEQDDAFDSLKEILTSEPVLLIPDVRKPFRIHVDACRVGKGIGAILLQENDEKKFQPVAYWSRALSTPERNYSATELECTALHDTILHWQPYLMNGLEFEAIVDHYALVYMVTKGGGAEAQQRLLRLCLDLQAFTFKVIHRSGVSHLDADAVSRLLGKDDQPYVRSANELRDDHQPLSLSEMEILVKRYGKDAKTLEPIINEGRKRLIQAQEESKQSIDRIKLNASRYQLLETTDPTAKLMKEIHEKHVKELEKSRKEKVFKIECAAFDARTRKLDVEDYKLKINSFLKINKIDATSISYPESKPINFLKNDKFLY
jgi:hypothetical protein